MPDVEDEAEGGGAGFKVELLRSYLAFARHSVRKRWLISTSILLTGLGLTVAALMYMPRTYSCSTVLMTLDNPVLDGRGGGNALAGASDLISRHDNLEAMIRDIGLVQKFESRRAPLAHLKDSVVRSLFGPMDEKTQISALVGTLESKINVTAERGDLTIKVEWADPRTAMELAEAARESFLKARHNAEMSAFEEKMGILDGHASKLRDEIGALAQQLKGARDEKIAEVREERTQANKANAAAAPAPRMMQPLFRSAAATPDEQTPVLKEKLAALQTQLSTIEADREKRLHDEQAKLDDLMLRLTTNHPAVVTQRERVGMLSQVPSDVALMRAEVKDLQGAIQQREGFSKLGTASIVGGGGGSTAAKTPAGELLSPDITELLQRDNLDPALTAQLSSTVMRYGALRDDLLSTRIDLDTAQAAFSHRYQVIVPAEVPVKADKPKPGVVFAVGLILSLLIALGAPVLSELRRGIIIESWQVEQLQLPVLAELHLPPHSSE